MRFTGLLFATLFTVSCGVGNRDSRTTFGTNFSSPALMELSPNAVPVNSVPFILTVNGTNFGTDAVVFWNDTPQSTRFISWKQLLAAVTDTDLMQFGLAQVFVRTGGLNSNTLDFDVTAQ